MLECPTVAPKNYNLWRVSSNSGSIGGYTQTNIGSGTLTNAAPLIINPAYSTLPSTPPYPQAPLDLTDADNYNFIGVATFLEFV